MKVFSRDTALWLGFAFLMAAMAGCASVRPAGTGGDIGGYPVSTNAGAQHSISEFQSQCMVVASNIAAEVTTAAWKERELMALNPPKSDVGEVAREFRLLGEANARTHPDYKDYGAEILAGAFKVCGDETNYFDMKLGRARSRHEVIGILGNSLFSMVKSVAPWYAGAKIAEELKDLNQTNTTVGGDQIGGDRINETTTEVFEPTVTEE